MSDRGIRDKVWDLVANRVCVEDLRPSPMDIGAQRGEYHERASRNAARTALTRASMEKVPRHGKWKGNPKGVGEQAWSGKRPEDDAIPSRALVTCVKVGAIDKPSVRRP